VSPETAIPPESDLGPDERVLWSGRPSADRLLMRADYLLIPSGILLGIAAFAGFFAALKRVTGGEPAAWLLVGLALAGLGAAWQMVIGHLIRRRRLAGATLYVLTAGQITATRRRRSGRLRVKSQPLEPGVKLAVHPQYEGRATIRVGRVTLFNVEGATRVESLIRQQLPAAGPQG
jgi:hypothetical protein